MEYLIQLLQEFQQQAYFEVEEELRWAWNLDLCRYVDIPQRDRIPFSEKKLKTRAVSCPSTPQAQWAINETNLVKGQIKPEIK